MFFDEVSMQITILDFFNDYLHYVETEIYSNNLKSLMDLASKDEASRSWVHKFSDLKTKPELEPIIHGLLCSSLENIQKNPNDYLKSSYFPEGMTNLKEIALHIKIALMSREQAEKKRRETPAITSEQSLTSAALFPTVAPQQMCVLSTPSPPRVSRPRLIQPQMKINYINFKSIAFTLGALALILLMAILLRRYLANPPRLLSFFSIPANNKITPTIDGVRISLDCSKIAGKFADCRNATTANELQTCLQILRIDETAVFAATPAIHTQLAELAPGCEMQMLIQNGASFSAVAKVISRGYETLVPPSAATMACLAHVLQH